MTQKRALVEAVRRWGRTAAVEAQPKAGRIGAHGEYVQSAAVISKMGPKHGRYLCRVCSTEALEDGNLVERRVWHDAGGWQTAYKVGVISLGMFFTVRGEGDSFEAAFEAAAGKAVA